MHTPPLPTKRRYKTNTYHLQEAQFSRMDLNYGLLNQSQSCCRCTMGNFIVENPGNDPGSPDFQSGAYTMFANSPYVEIKGFEPLTSTV